MVGRVPCPGASVGAADRHVARCPAETVTVVTAAGVVVWVPAWVSAGAKVTVAVILHATGKAGADAPANMVGVPNMANPVTGKAKATNPNRILRRVFMIPPHPSRRLAPSAKVVVD